MASIYDEETTSGFVRPDDILRTESFTDFSSVKSRGYCLLVRAKRYGRWWMLKGLKEEFRQDAIYQVLLQKEYEITSQLQHPMIVSAFSFEEVEKLGHCMVMEWIDGVTLREWLAKGKHTKKQRRHIADMLLEALIYVHGRQTQHRDLKPSNIMITQDGQHLKLIDFGLADTDSHVILKAPAGTEGYMAPEGSSDIYSLGCVLRDLRLGWLSRMVVRKCCAPLSHRYSYLVTIKRDLHRCWLWPRRILLIICLATMAAGLFLLNRSHVLQNQQAVADSLNVLRKENSAIKSSERARIDSFQVQMNLINEQHHAEQVAAQQHKAHIESAKKQIDLKLQAYGIQQMLDTVSCQRNIDIPFLRIVDELIRDTEDPELKAYIEERYRQPWIKRMKELPFE